MRIIYTCIGFLFNFDKILSYIEIIFDTYFEHSKNKI